MLPTPLDPGSGIVHQTVKVIIFYTKTIAVITLEFEQTGFKLLRNVFQSYVKIRFFCQQQVKIRRYL